MELNIPKATTASHEVPIFNDLARDSNLPVSEVKARFRNKMLELHDKAMKDPSILSVGGGNDELVKMAVNELRKELQHPEESSDDEDEYDKLMGFDPNEPPPGGDIFDAPADNSFGGASGGFGGGFGGGDFGGGGSFGGGIDNMDLGFSDEGMDAVNSVENGEFDDFGSEADAGSINAMSETEPGGGPDEADTTETGADETSTPDDLSGSDDLAEI